MGEEFDSRTARSAVIDEVRKLGSGGFVVPPPNVLDALPLVHADSLFRLGHLRSGVAVFDVAAGILDRLPESEREKPGEPGGRMTSRDAIGRDNLPALLPRTSAQIGASWCKILTCNSGESHRPAGLPSALLASSWSMRRRPHPSHK